MVQQDSSDLHTVQLQPKLKLGIEPSHIRSGGVLLESRQRSKIDSPFAQLEYFAFVRVSHNFVRVAGEEGGDEGGVYDGAGLMRGRKEKGYKRTRG
jgi:hypothetical protein